MKVFPKPAGYIRPRDAVIGAEGRCSVVYATERVEPDGVKLSLIHNDGRNYYVDFVFLPIEQLVRVVIKQ